MPRRKESSVEEEIPVDIMDLLSHVKKHKKHKHKKHKRKRETESDQEGGSEDGSPSHVGDGLKQGLKLKIKIGGQTFGETRLSKHGKQEDPLTGECGTPELDIDESVNILTGSMPLVNTSKKVRKVDEEEAWLAALEAGRLEEVDDELKRMKDPTLMTARQRSLLESKAQKDKEESTPVVHEEKEMTEEMIQRKIIRAKKRKEQAEEKREKDKKQTIERLLKKTDSKVKGAKKFSKKTDVPKITYINNQTNGWSLSLPAGFDYPLERKTAKSPPKTIICGVKGCGNAKRYNCSKTGVPLCSLRCYKANLVAHNKPKGRTLVK